MQGLHGNSGHISTCQVSGGYNLLLWNTLLQFRWHGQSEHQWYWGGICTLTLIIAWHQESCFREIDMDPYLFKREERVDLTVSEWRKGSDKKIISSYWKCNLAVHLKAEEGFRSSTSIISIPNISLLRVVRRSSAGESCLKHKGRILLFIYLKKKTC